MASKFTKKEKALRTYLQGCFGNPDPSISIRQREKWRLELQALEKTANQRKIDRELAKARKLEEEIRESNEDDEFADDESEDDGEAPAQRESPTPKLASSDLIKMPALELCELFSKQKWFRTYLDVTDNSELIAVLEVEIRRRRLPMYFSVEGTNLYQDENGKPVPDLKNRVYMGEVPNPNPPEPEEEYTFTPTPSSLQSAYWNRGKAKPAV